MRIFINQTIDKQINTHLSKRSATGSAYLASDAVNRTHS